MSESYEHCMECDSLTGRAGRAEDSLYHGYIGPFCEDCFEDWPDEQVAKITTLRQQLAKSEARVAELERDNTHQRLRDALERAASCLEDAGYMVACDSARSLLVELDNLEKQQ